MGAVFSAFAGKMKKSHFVYKGNGHPKIVWRQTLQIGNAKKIDDSGPGRGAEVARSASPSVIRRSARCCISPLQVLLR